MEGRKNASPAARKFVGIEIPPDLGRRHFAFLYFNTFLIALLMGVPAIVQPALLKDVVKVSLDFFGSTNGLLQNMSQVATLLFVGYIGMLSDRTGRKILAIIGFSILAVFFYLYFYPNQIAEVLHLPKGFCATVCAAMSFAPTRAAEFTDFAPGLLAAYAIRLVIGIGLVSVYPQFVTMVADYIAPKDRGKGMALNGMMIGLGSILIFAVLAPVGRKTGIELLFYIAVAIAVAGVLFTAAGLKERLPEKRGKEKGIIEVLKVVNKSLALKTSYLCSLIVRADIVVIPTYLIAWAVKLADEYGITSEAATFRGSIPMIIVGVVSMLAMPLTGILLDKWGRIPTIVTALFLLGLALLLIAVSPAPLHMLVIVAAVMASFGMAGALVGPMALAADASPKALAGPSV
jgi:MFS family permease